MVSLLLLAGLLLLPAGAGATFNDIGVGARPLGLGGAFVALADDGNAANYNAAGLAFIPENRLSATYAQRFNGLITYNAVSGVIPFGRIGAIGVSFGDLAEDSDIYHEQTFRLSYANALSKRVAIGANLKYFRTAFDAANEFVADNPYFDRTTTGAPSADLGIIVKPFQSLNIGASVENLLPADMSVSEAQTDSVPLNIRAGFAYKLDSIAEMSAQGAAVSDVLSRSLVTLEVATRNGDTTIRTGAEIWVNTAIAIRGGGGIKSGGSTATTLTLGGSAKLPLGQTTLQLDYGVQLLSGDFDDNITQRFSLNLLR